MRLGRLLTAMVTPFDADLNVDYGRARELARMLVSNGSDGVVVSGTTGESPTLTNEEKLRLFKEVKEELGDSYAVVAGTGNYCTSESVELTRAAAEVGVDAVMAVVPYYNNPPQEGLYRHFRAIAEASPVPLILYNVPSRSPRNLEPSTVVRLASDVKNVVAVKEASKNLEQITEIIAKTPEGFLVYSGDDSTTLPILGVGGYGIISVASHVAGPQIRRMIDAFVEGRTSEAQAINRKLMPLFKALFVTSNPIPVKAALRLSGFPVGGLRLPLVEATEAEEAVIAAAMKQSIS
ncbi:MAG: 4-hydroxy-tetrahydrodipicolinate synthase [Armatimonadota bacterium]